MTPRVANLASTMMFAAVLVATQFQSAQGAPFQNQPAQTSKTKLTANELLHPPADGIQLTRAKKYKEALAWAEKRLKSNPKDLDTLFLKAHLQLILKQNTECLATCQKLIKAKAHQGHAHTLRGSAYTRMKDYASALIEANEAVKFLPYEEGAMSLRKNIHRELRDGKEMDRDESMRLILSDLRNAWDRVIEKSFEEVRPNEFRKTTYKQEYSTGLKAFTRMSFSSAVDYFSRVIKLKPDWLEAYLFRAQSLETLDRWSEAIPDLSYLISKGDSTFIPVHVVPYDSKIPVEKWDVINLPMGEAHKRRARCYAALRKYSQAIADMDVAVKHAPEDRWTRELRGNINSSYKKYKEAIDDYLIAESLGPDYQNCGPKIVECCIAMGDYESAVKRLSWILAITPADDVLLMQRADCLSHLGFHNDAIIDLSSILSMDDEYIEAYLRRGREYESLGNLKASLDDYTKAMNLDQGTTDKSQRAFAGRDRVLKLMKKKP